MSVEKQGVSRAVFYLTSLVVALFGALIGGGAVYLAVSDRLASQPTPASAQTTFVPAEPAQTVRAVDIQTAVTDAVSKAGPAVVTVVNHLSSGGFTSVYGQLEAHPRASGSGVFISEEGYLVTNNHVIRGGQSFEVILRDGRTLPAKLIGTDDFADLAVLKIDGSPAAISDFGNSDALKPGETVIAIGSPLGEFQNTVTVGVVSATGRSLVTGESFQMEDLIQTDAAINRGNSGGPLINLAGQIVGINTLVVRSGGSGDMAEGIGFAIASNTVSAIVNQLIAQGYVRRPFLGIQWQLITPALARQYELPVDWGVYITSLSGNGPAAQAGLKAGDIIARLGGTAIDEKHPFINLLLRYTPGERVEITYLRGRRPRTTTVTMGNRGRI